MRKILIILFLIFTPFFLFSNKSDAKYSGIPLAEYDSYPLLILQSGEILAEIIILPENFQDEIAVKEIIGRLDRLPIDILEKVHEHNIKIVLFQGKLTDNESLAHLRGITPRGYPKSIVWDDVPGIGGTDLVYVKIGSSNKGEGHGSVNLEYHELAHSLYNIVYNDPSENGQFKQIWQTEAKLLYPDHLYLQQYIEEYFAESFAHYFLSPETQTLLKATAPQTFQFISELY
ncbi:MAG TPA: toxin [Bacillaceae bacterium]|nr:toxin [Paenibacillus bovis]HLU21379.1 toxin [Bacillaceae bacterium]